MATTPNNSGIPKSSTVLRLRDLDERHRRGEISRATYEAERQRILSEGRPAAPTRPAGTQPPRAWNTRPSRPPALAYTLAVTALCAPLSQFLWWVRIEDRVIATAILLPRGGYILLLSLTAAITGAAGWASLSVFRERAVTWPTVAALPVLLTCTIRGAASLSAGSVTAMFGGGAFASFVMSGTAIASAVLILNHLRRSGFTRLESNGAISVLGGLAAFCSLLLFFGNGWSGGFLITFGARWDVASMWFAWSSILALITTVAVPLLAGFARHRLLSLWFAVGGLVDLAGYYGSLVWLGLDGTLTMNTLVLFLFASFGLLLAIAVLQIQAIREERVPLADAIGAI